jgi:hypothetical protein
MPVREEIRLGRKTTQKMTESSIPIIILARIKAEEENRKQVS